MRKFAGARLTLKMIWLKKIFSQIYRRCTGVTDIWWSVYWHADTLFFYRGECFNI